MTLGRQPRIGEGAGKIPGVITRPSPRMAAFTHQFRAEILATAGDTAAALGAAVAAEAAGTFDIAWAERCPSLSSLREEPAFIDVSSRIRARAEQIRGAFRRAAT